jgi:hypothetical protein
MKAPQLVVCDADGWIAKQLRELAAWYREFAEKTANPSIWEARLRMA